MKKIIIAALIISTGIVFSCQSKDEKPKVSTSKKAVAKVDGQKIYKMNCVVCHGMDGKLGINNAGDITVSEKTLEERIELVTNGKNTMTAFGSLLKEDQIKAVAQYTFNLK